MSKFLSWIGSAFNGITKNHIEGFGAATAASMLIVYVASTYMKKKRPSQEVSCRFCRSQSLAILHGGKVAMQRMIEAHHALSDPSLLEDAEKELEDLLSCDKLSFSQLQRVVAKLEMTKKEDKALESLRKAHSKATDDCQFHEAYELDMLIVEMLIYKGEYKEAMERDCLKHEQISDARRPLYQAIIALIEGQKNRAEEYWNKFRALRSYFKWPDSILDDDEGTSDPATLDFNQFDKSVSVLKKEIDEHKKPK